MLEDTQKSEYQNVRHNSHTGGSHEQLESFHHRSRNPGLAGPHWLRWHVGHWWQAHLCPEQNPCGLLMESVWFPVRRHEATSVLPNLYGNVRPGRLALYAHLVTIECDPKCSRYPVRRTFLELQLESAILRTEATTSGRKASGSGDTTGKGTYANPEGRHLWRLQEWRRTRQTNPGLLHPRRPGSRTHELSSGLGRSLGRGCLPGDRDWLRHLELLTQSRTRTECSTQGWGLTERLCHSTSTASKLWTLRRLAPCGWSRRKGIACDAFFNTLRVFSVILGYE